MADHHEEWKPDTLTRLIEQVNGLRRDTDRHERADEEMFQKIHLGIESLRALLETKYVTKEELTPTKAIAYGIVSVFMLAVLTAIAALVVIGGGRAKVGP